MALWVIEALGRAPIDVPDGPLHRVRAAHWVQRPAEYGAVFVHTFLLDTDVWATDGAGRLLVESLVARSDGAWDVAGKPAQDGVYPDLRSRRAFVVRDGVIVATLDA